MNQINIIGNISTAPTYRSVETSRGQATVCNFSVAVNEYFQGKESTTFFRVSLWNNLADRASKILTLGSMVFVSGRVRLNLFKDRDDNDKGSLEITGRDFSLLKQGQKTQEQDRSYQQNRQKSQITSSDDESEYGEVDLNDTNIKKVDTSNMSFKESILDIENASSSKNHMGPKGNSKFHDENEGFKSTNVNLSDLDEEGEDYE